MMKVAQIRELTEEELRQMNEETQKRIDLIRAKEGIGEVAEHPLEIRRLKRELARVKTIMQERRLAQNG